MAQPVQEPQPQIYGKIYALYSNELLDEDSNPYLYIGSTRNTYMSRRIKGHKDDYETYMKGKRTWVSSFWIMEKTSNPGYFILEQGYYASKEALRSRENEYILHYKGRALNNQKAFQTEEARERVRNRRQNNPERVREKERNWRQNNPERVREKERKWRQNNPERKRVSERKRYQNNKINRCNTCNTNPMTLKEYNKHCKTSKHQQNKEVDNVVEEVVEDALQEDE